MTDTVESVTRQIFEVMRAVASPLFTERGFIDVASRIESAQNLGTLLEAMHFADQVCNQPEVVQAAFHEIRTACRRVKEVHDAGGLDSNKLAFAQLQALNAAGMFQDARNGKLTFDDNEVQQ